MTASLSVTVEDDDGPVQAHIDSGGIVSLTEGGRRTYRIWLASAPTEQVTVALTAPSKVSVRAVNAAGKGAASAPMPAVTPAAPGLTGSFESVPEALDGSSAFALRLAFSEDVAGRFRNMRNDIFEVTGGALTDLRRVDRRRDLWTVTVTPSSDDAVTVAVPANRACDVSGAVCTADGEQLASRAEVTVPGPQPTVSVSAGPGPVSQRASDRASLPIIETE